MNERTEYGFTVLQAATIRQMSPYIKAILAVDGLVINMKDYRQDHDSSDLTKFGPKQFPHKYVVGATALHYACLTGNLEIIELLLKAGADWAADDSEGRKPEDLFHDRLDEDVKRAYVKLRDCEFGKVQEVMDPDDAQC